MALALAGAFALPASAADDTRASTEAGSAKHAGSAAGPTRTSRFDELDRNHDGYISRDEAKDAPELNTRYSELDVNNDGKLSRDEYNAIHRSASGATSGTTSSAPAGK